MKTDFLIIGGGIIGLTTARALKKRRPHLSVVVIEKEKRLGEHASGRNSGVLHAGFYYTADSLKARFTRDGNRRMTRFCEDKGLQLNRCGKLVVANTDEELEGLDELFRRAKKNGVEVDEVCEREAQKIEPRARTKGRALFSPHTSVVDPLEVIGALENEVRALGVQIWLDCPFLKKRGESVITKRGRIDAGYVINAAGLYADRVAHAWGVGKEYRILPFKGLYLYAKTPFDLNTNIYPVPNLKNPFLGVHFTLTAAGKVKIGPTAIPALWREQYQKFDNFSVREFSDIAWRQAKLLLQPQFRSLAKEEVKKYRKGYMAGLARNLAHDIDPAIFSVWGKAGIRAQLFDTKAKKLEMDFVLRKGKDSCHVLNAVSPALTCSFAFSDYLLDEIEIF
ncbi:MAG: L-2-hydroxyglutarate oxidase [Chlamydiales bacterium]|nr:L-2-hydroxyglutarate oxidase [Chlamydiales bacterium]